MHKHCPSGEVDPTLDPPTIAAPVSQRMTLMSPPLGTDTILLYSLSLIKSTRPDSPLYLFFFLCSDVASTFRFQGSRL